jgi:hypothetical protein
MLARLSMLDAHGRRCCPDCWAARRLCCVEVVVRGEAGDDVLREAERLRRLERLVARTGGRALLAAYLEALAASARVVCALGHPVEVESLRARLLAGVVWS